MSIPDLYIADIDEGHNRPSPAGRQGYAFYIDVERCECGGKLKIVAAIEAPGVIVRVLSHLGLPARAPPQARARLPQLIEVA